MHLCGLLHCTVHVHNVHKPHGVLTVHERRWHKEIQQLASATAAVYKRQASNRVVDSINGAYALLCLCRQCALPAIG
jgi:hypothetical protein